VGAKAEAAPGVDQPEISAFDHASYADAGQIARNKLPQE
jgi:hypothetical protein